jgi:hypothetical protein
MSIALYEGDTVSYVGVAMPPAHGKLLYFASDQAAHVKWASGTRQGEIDIVDVYDLEPVTAAQAVAVVDPMGHTAVRRVMDADGEAGVINFLVTSSQTTGWPTIAADVLAYVEDRIRVDASMEMPQEQLSPVEYDRVVGLASRALLRDAFGDLEEPE